ncbi:MAG TPA: T9SS type A sorting domain-containing protein, partial [Bacteroidota bacterium]|nr:T9SS type A sorting domain-containing protein [Bacteroidota bacterium]
NEPIGVPFKLFLTFSDPQGFEKRDTLDLYFGLPTVVFSDSASAGTTNWDVGTGWGITSDAHSVPDAFTDSPSGLYLANANNSLTTLSDIDLAGFHYVQLRYWTKWAIEPTKDFALVEISTNSGTSWTTLRSKLSHSSSGAGSQSPAGIWGYESYTPGLTWVEQQVDLSSYVDKQVKLRFRVIADGTKQRDGFYVDDIRLLGYTTMLVAPTLVLPFNAAMNQPLSLMLKWNESGGASSYRLQVSTDSTFTTLILDDSTITDTIKHISLLSDSTTYYWRVSARNTNGSSDWSSPVWFFRTGIGIFTMSVLDRWNMISVPLSVEDPRKDVLFQMALSAAFAYQLGIGYVEHDSLRNGAGYWLKFFGDQQVGLTGFGRLHDTVTVVEGWNLIGSLSSTIPANTIEQLPTDIVQSNFFTYQDGYVLKDSLEPGKGYWVKVGQHGKLVLSSQSNTNIVTTHNKMPAGRSILEQFNRLIITDHAGSSMVLYFTDQMVDEMNDRDYELPPIPPTEIFDARFETHRIISLFASTDPQFQEVKILLQSNLYPINVSWEFVGKNYARYEITDEQNGKFLQTQVLESNGGITITNPSITSFILRRQTEIQKPKIFSLEQNYPNPFNPQTSMQFSLPTPSLVTIKLYDLLGQEIQTIVQQQYQSGIHTINFDGTDLQSGVYLYKLTVNPENGEKSIQLMRKMVYLK